MVHEMWRWDMNEENIFSSGFSTSALQGLRDRPLHLCAHTRVHTHTHTLQSTHSRYLLNAGESLAGNSISSSAHMPPHKGAAHACTHRGGRTYTPVCAHRTTIGMHVETHRHSGDRSTQTQQVHTLWADTCVSLLPACPVSR